MNTGYSGTRRKYDTSVFYGSKLSNGVPLWSQSPPIILNDAGAIVVAFPQVGGLQDPISQSGTAHFFEHIPFKGTVRFPAPAEVERVVEAESGSIGATTSSDWTMYRVVLPKDRLELAATVAYELAFNPLIREEDAVLERGVIASEYRRFYSDGGKRAFSDIKRRLFPGSPYAMSPIGELPVIEAMTPKHLCEFQSAFYHAGNAHIICGGAFSERKDAREIIEATFGSVAKSRSEAVVQALPKPAVGELELTNPLYQRDCLAMLWFMERVSFEENFTLGLLASAISRSVSSPLSAELRTRRGLVYETSLLRVATFPKHEMYYSIIPVKRGHFEVVQETVLRCIAELDEETVTRELKYSQRGRLLAFSNNVGVCTEAGGGIVDDITLYGRPMSFEEGAEAEDAITMPEIERWKKYLLNNPPVVARVLAG